MANLLNQLDGFSRSLPPIAAEYVGARLMKRLGIGAPTELRIASASEAKAAGSEWLRKSYREGRLKWWGSREPSATNLLIRKIPGAISLRALRKRFGITGSRPEMLEAKAPILFDREGEDPESDFTPPDGLSSIRAAIEWDSDAMLQIHAARMFLCCSAGHEGNILTDCNARLYSVDHEICVETDATEIQVLAEKVKPVTRAWKALRHVAALTPADLERLFEDLPESAWPLGSKAETIAYYQSRLATWREAFA